MVNTAKLYFDGNNNAQFIKGEIDESVYSYGELRRFDCSFQKLANTTTRSQYY